MTNENKMTAECKVHWNHGAPGAVPTFLSAATLFNFLGITEKAVEYEEVARKAVEAVWQFGLLLKGNGLCEGISGNGYALHSLARWYFRKSLTELEDP